MLRPDGRFRRHELQGKPLGRTHLARSRHLDAADAEYFAPPLDLDTSDIDISHHRTFGDLCLPARKRAYRLGHGNMRLGGPPRRNLGNAKRRLPNVVGNLADLLRTSSNTHLAFRTCFQKTELDKRR